MQANDFEKFREGISGVMGFYEKTLAPFAFDAWWNALKAYDLQAVVDAFNRHLSNPDAGQYPPKPADIIRMLQGSTQDTALRAWAKVDQSIRQIGPYLDVVFDDALIHRVIQDMGGWIALGTKAEDEWPFVAKEFENRYRGFKIRSEKPEYRAILIGIATASNNKQGFKAELPVLIGNELRALQVMQGGSDKPSIGFKRMSEDIKPVKQLRAVC
jgi:hypothetical protein